MINVGIYTIHGSYGKGKSLVKFDIIHVSLVPFVLGSLSHGPARSPCVEGASLVTPKLLRTTTHLASPRILTTHDRHPMGPPQPTQ